MRKRAVSLRGRGMDRHWRRSICFSLALIALVVAGIGAEWTFAVSTLATCAIGLGFFVLAHHPRLRRGLSHEGTSQQGSNREYWHNKVFHKLPPPSAPNYIPRCARSGRTVLDTGQAGGCEKIRAYRTRPCLGEGFSGFSSRQPK
jgi:hypothetical protein